MQVVKAKATPAPGNRPNDKKEKQAIIDSKRAYNINILMGSKIKIPVRLARVYAQHAQHAPTRLVVALSGVLLVLLVLLVLFVQVACQATLQRAGWHYWQASRHVLFFMLALWACAQPCWRPQVDQLRAKVVHLDPKNFDSEESLAALAACIPSSDDAAALDAYKRSGKGLQLASS